MAVSFRDLDNMEVVEGGRDPSGLTEDDMHGLPAGLYDDIVSIISAYCDQYNIPDQSKITPHQWKAICIYTGQVLKKRQLLRDMTRIKEGGFRYDGEKVAALLDLYEYICAQYGQVPFAYNFMHFAGISRQYFGDYADRLTSGRVNIRQKAYEIQRAGLVDAVTGGGAAAVGNIFLSKALGGLQETTTIQHVSVAAAAAPAALPVFGENTHKLVETRSNETENGED